MYSSANFLISLMFTILIFSTYADKPKIIAARDHDERSNRGLGVGPILKDRRLGRRMGFDVGSQVVSRELLAPDRSWRLVGRADEPVGHAPSPELSNQTLAQLQSGQTSIQELSTQENPVQESPGQENTVPTQPALLSHSSGSDKEPLDPSFYDSLIEELVAGGGSASQASTTPVEAGPSTPYPPGRLDVIPIVSSSDDMPPSLNYTPPTSPFSSSQQQGVSPFEKERPPAPPSPFAQGSTSEQSSFFQQTIEQHIKDNEEQIAQMEAQMESIILQSLQLSATANELEQEVQQNPAGLGPAFEQLEKEMLAEGSEEGFLPRPVSLGSSRIATLGGSQPITPAGSLPENSQPGSAEDSPSGSYSGEGDNGEQNIDWSYAENVPPSLQPQGPEEFEPWQPTEATGHRSSNVSIRPIIGPSVTEPEIQGSPADPGIEAPVAESEIEPPVTDPVIEESLADPGIEALVAEAEIEPPISDLEQQPEATVGESEPLEPVPSISTTEILPEGEQPPSTVPTSIGKGASRLTRALCCARGLRCCGIGGKGPEVRQKRRVKRGPEVLGMYAGVR